VMRASVIEQSNMDYVTTARAKGQTERGILFGHILRNALLPIITMAGVQAGNLIGGSVVVESVFGWPGIGTLAFSALQGRDLNLLLGIFLVSACVVVVINLMVDLAYVVLDPRMDV
jgi:peptide/nickel transport system permease protein